MFLRTTRLSAAHVVGVGFDNLETRDFEPVLGFGVSLSAMDVYRFVPFIGVIEPPAENHLESLGIVRTPLFVDIVPPARYQVTLHVPRHALDAAQLAPACSRDP